MLGNATFHEAMKYAVARALYPELMNEKFSLSSAAALLAEPAQASMLTALLDDRPKSAGELARIANVSPQSASMHLSHDPELCFARTCYDHLAGELGVRLAAAMEQNQVLVPAGERLRYQPRRVGVSGESAN
jgi:DNA-binding transcriptional ArsR family regulator